MGIKTALIFDDDLFFRNFLSDIFKDAGFKITAYSCHSECRCFKNLDKCSSEVPCFEYILTDQFMPNSTGLEFLKKLKDIGCKIPLNNQAIISGAWGKKGVEEAGIAGYTVIDKYNCPTQIHNWVKESNN